VTSRSGPTVAHFSAQAERKGSPIPHREYRTCWRHGGPSDPRRRFDIVAVARQTQIHMANLDGRRSPSVPGASPHRPRCTASVTICPSIKRSVLSCGIAVYVLVRELRSLGPMPPEDHPDRQSQARRGTSRPERVPPSLWHHPHFARLLAGETVSQFWTDDLARGAGAD
jgi:hypothetical protein